MSIPKIEHLDTLITQYVGEDKKLMHTKITRLTASGENYGSEIFKVDLFLKSPDAEEEEEVNVVAKLIPDSEFFRIMFNIQVTFNNEQGFYDTVVPALHAFQREQGVQDILDIFPKFYGARRNLKNDDKDPIDQNAVIILENLKVKGYVNVDRFTGFDLPTTKLILRNLAQFHAVPLALKINDPATFESKVKKYLACYHPSAPTPPSDDLSELITKLMENSSKCRHLVPKMLKSFKTFGTVRNDYKEPFATIGHKDLWINNIMVKFDGATPIDCKFVDFQMYSYDSPAADLFFFLFSSVETDVLQEHLDDLLRFYHKHFVECLKSLNCKISFTFEDLLAEISDCTLWELSHIVVMYLFIINGKKGGPPPPVDGNAASPPDFSQMELEESKVQRVMWMINEIERRGWLQF